MCLKKKNENMKFKMTKPSWKDTSMFEKHYNFLARFNAKKAKISIMNHDTKLDETTFFAVKEKSFKNVKQHLTST